MNVKDSEIEIYKKQISFKVFSTAAYALITLGIVGAAAFAGGVITPWVLSFIPHTAAMGIVRFLATVIGWGTIPAMVVSNPKRIFRALRARVYGWFKKIKKLEPAELAFANLEQVRKQYESAKLFHSKAKELGKRIDQDYRKAKQDFTALESELLILVPDYKAKQNELSSMSFEEKAEFQDLASKVKRKIAEFNASEKALQMLEAQKREHEQRTLMVQSKYLEFENLVAQSEYVYKVICSQVRYADDMESFKQEFENLRANTSVVNINSSMDSEVLQQELEFRVSRADALFQEMMSPDAHQGAGDSSMGYDLGIDLERFTNHQERIQ